MRPGAMYALRILNSKGSRRKAASAIPFRRQNKRRPNNLGMKNMIVGDAARMSGGPPGFRRQEQQPHCLLQLFIFIFLLLFFSTKIGKVALEFSTRTHGPARCHLSWENALEKATSAAWPMPFAAIKIKTQARRWRKANGQLASLVVLFFMHSEKREPQLNRGI